MEINPEDTLSDTFLKSLYQKRKKLLPRWIRVFSWIFLCAGLITPMMLVAGFLSHNFKTNFIFDLALYGFRTQEPFSMLGLCLLAIFLFKGIVAFLLLWEKDSGPRMAMIDAGAGIIICVAYMLYSIFYTSLTNFRLELILLIPYLLRMVKIQPEWDKQVGFKTPGE